MTKIPRAVALLVACVTLAACGGSEPKKPSPADAAKKFVAEYQAVGDKYHSDLCDIVESGETAARQESWAGMAENTAALATLYDNALQDYRELEPPAEFQSAYKNYLAAFEQGNDQIDRMADAAKDEDLEGWKRATEAAAEQGDENKESRERLNDIADDPLDKRPFDGLGGDDC